MWIDRNMLGAGISSNPIEFHLRFTLISEFLEEAPDYWASLP